MRIARALALYATAAAVACSRRSAEWRAGFVDAPVAAVASQTTGRVESIVVREGARVTTGQLLAQIDARERQAAVAEADANLERARESLAEAQQNLRAAQPEARGASADAAKAAAALDEAAIEFGRTERLVRSGSLAPAELDAARSRLDQARAALDSAQATHSGTGGRIGAAAASVANARWAVRSSQAQLDLARVQLAQSQVLAPFAGVVVERDVEEGEWAAPGTPIVTVEDLERAWVRLDVGEKDFAGLHLGQPADVSVLALPGRTLHGRVTEVGAQGDFAINRDVKRGTPDLRTFLVRVALDDPTDVLPGMSAEVRLLPSPAAPAGATPQALP
jgi:multidrug resistance efflux pump